MIYTEICSKNSEIFEKKKKILKNYALYFMKNIDVMLYEVVKIPMLKRLLSL